MNIRRFSPTPLLIALSLSFPVVSTAQDASTHAEPPASPADNSARADTSSADRKQASHDAKFVKETLIGGMFEVQAGQLALRNGSSPEVHTLAQHIVDDHTQAGEKLEAIAQQEGMTNLPTQLDAKHQHELDKLKKLSGSAFDREYSALMVSDHKKDIKAFEKEAAHGSDAQIKQFAADTVPTLKGHLSMAEAAKHAAAGSHTRTAESNADSATSAGTQSK